MSVFEKQLHCQCGITLNNGDELYNHLFKTGHKLRDTIYKTEDSVLIDQKLMQWRLELYSAVQMLQGDHLEQFKKLIAEIATLCKLEVSDTGTFTRQDI
jgi:hypothetical protein